MTVCPKCDLRYVESFGPDVRQHNTHCRKVATLKEKYGELFLHNDREAAKAEGWNEVHDDSLPLDKRVDGAIKVLWSWFSRSVLSAMTPEHPEFQEYASMILNQEHTKKSLPEPVLTVLTEQYGQQPGIPEGRSYWKPIRK